MTAPTLRYMDDPNATLREKLKTAKALVKDGRVTEAASFLEAAANQNAGQQLQSVANLLRRGQLSRSFRALACLLRAERYRKEMRMLQAQFEHFARSQSATDETGDDDPAIGRPTAAAAAQGANVSAKLLRLATDRNATLKERLKASRMLINEGRVSQALSVLQTGIDQTASDRLGTAYALLQCGEVIRSMRALECIFRPGKYRAKR